MSGTPNEPAKSPLGLSVIPTAVILHSVASSLAQLAVPMRLSLKFMFVLSLPSFVLISTVPFDVKYTSGRLLTHSTGHISSTVLIS